MATEITLKDPVTQERTVVESFPHAAIVQASFPSISLTPQAGGQMGYTVLLRPFYIDANNQRVYANNTLKLTMSDITVAHPDPNIEAIRSALQTALNNLVDLTQAAVQFIPLEQGNAVMTNVVNPMSERAMAQRNALQSAIVLPAQQPQRGPLGFVPKPAGP